MIAPSLLLHDIFFQLLYSGHTFRCKAIMPRSHCHENTFRTSHVSGVASEVGTEETKHWRDKPLFENNGLPLQCFVCSEPSDAPGRPRIYKAFFFREIIGRPVPLLLRGLRGACAYWKVETHTPQRSYT